MDLAAMFFILTFYVFYFTREEKHLVPKSVLDKYKIVMAFTLAVALIFTLSTLPFFAGTIVWSSVSDGTSYYISLRSMIWFVAYFVSMSRRLFEFHDGRRARRFPG